MSLDIEQLSSAKFPECISQGLKKLEEINKLPSTPHLHKLQQQIIEEHILNFHDSSSNHKEKVRLLAPHYENKQENRRRGSEEIERSRRAGRHQKTIGAVEELIIVRCIAEYLAKIVDPANRNSLYITLFPAVSNEAQSPFKIRVLAALVSLAVATHNVAVLDATAVWMQQVSCFSVRCCRVSYGLIQDFFQSNVETPPHFLKALKSLPTATPLFTANLITSLAQVYAKVGTNEMCEEPPLHLVRIVTHWLKTNPQILLSPLTTSLPGISLPMTSVLALSPLAKWCIEAPLFPSKDHDKEGKGDDDVYDELHLLLLQTLRGVSNVRAQMTQREVICAEHLKNVIDVFNIRLNNCECDSAKEKSLNRLAQIILVALHTNCVSGRIADMWNALRKLPDKPRLMRTLLSFNPC